ncbi:U11/U12 small nuclear ribonucleoprotein 48 kDa protein [Actinidia eriantha]|uniref:U11/U12 small nuclear ribonucleoprotein 48 kDa protein n=1 Tax=Actinidia eriantha TaxID=165200 RepID=UPI002588B126|nr:U11/U12 small nuclear ribonucleoprotein 48 kDa protein [Actinidia eriantha]XP_057463137.1 U11/U12 small nuclear ribonucleoprotein 48 kDa protein [Actinidia eriantha]
MNPPTLYPSPPPTPSFTFLPPPPNPNPNFFHSLPTPTPNLAAALSTLKALIRSSETTIASISTLLPPTTTTALSPCPFNSRHQIPPEYLFRHSLHCPSDLHLKPLHYPTTLQSSQELIEQNRFVQTPHDPNADLCFSLDEFSDSGSNFFYRDCPGVVSSADRDSTSRTFTLPGFLSGGCANFMGDEVGEIKGFSSVLLTSELWVVRSEIETWRDYPASYSYSVLRAILYSLIAEESDFLRWVVVNSPRYGVLIDVPLRDHIVLLFQLCLKAIAREANLLFNGDAVGLNRSGMSFKCPILVEVLKWLSFQFSVLYGEVNGKMLAIDMLKQWILNASPNSSLFPLRVVDGKSAETFEKTMEDEGNVVLNESTSGRVIFVSQVAAAVAALHERSLLEEKIKALRDTRPRPSYQRMAEHGYFSKMANEERQKRSNYRPLLEHDGLFWQRPHNQESNKTKTREELLAEERDYKRRRMSYRGKKLKRNTTQVMRDIIEEYMEEITQAGGIGCLTEAVEEAKKFTSEPSLYIATDVDGLKKNVYDSSEITREQAHGYKKQLYPHNNVRSTRSEYESPEYQKHRRRESSRHQEHLEAQRSVDRDKRDRDYYSRSPDRQRSNSRSHDRIRYHGHRDSHSRSHERSNHQREPGDRNSELKDRQQRQGYRDRRSDSVTLRNFEDRYDPSESCDM